VRRLSISKRNRGKTERARQDVSSVYSMALKSKSAVSRTDGQPQYDFCQA
jgi:hypothetical protein